MDKTFVSLILIFLLSFAIFTTVIVFDKPISSLIRAKEDFQTSSKNSIIIAWPLQAKADGKSETTISVFVRNQLNKPVTNAVVNLQSSLGIIKEQNVITDKEGLAVFHLTSVTPGSAEITASLDKGVQLLQKISIKFE